MDAHLQCLAQNTSVPFFFQVDSKWGKSCAQYFPRCRQFATFFENSFHYCGVICSNIFHSWAFYWKGTSFSKKTSKIASKSNFESRRYLLLNHPNIRDLLSRRRATASFT